MTTFDTLFAAYGMPQLLVMYGETITYRPRGGGTRSISAIVERLVSDPLNVMNGIVAPRLTITVYNDSTTGISTSEIDTGGDQVDVSVKKGEAVATLPISRLAGSDGGCTTFEVV